MPYPLQYPVDRIVVQMVDVAADRPAYLPNYTSNNGIINQNIPLISAHLTYQIQSNCDKNPLRKYMLNQFGQNCFNNVDFNNLLMNTIKHFEIAMARGEFPNIEALIQARIPVIVECACLANAIDYPDLKNYIHPSALDNANQKVGIWMNMLNEIHQVMQPVQNGPWNQPHNANSFMNSPPSPNSFPENRAVNYSGTHQQSGLYIHTSGRVPNEPRPLSTRQIGGEATSDQVLAQPFTARTPPVESVRIFNQPGNQEQFVEAVVKEEKKIDWEWSLAHPYPMAINPYTQTVRLEKDVEGNTRPIYTTRESEIVDFEKHSIITVFGQPSASAYSPGDVVKNRTDLATGVEAINIVTAKMADENVIDKPEEYATVVRDKVIADVSIDIAWLLTSASRLAAMDKEIPFVYRAYATIPELFVAAIDESDIVADFGSAKTFKELREKMIMRATTTTRELWSACHDKVTECINRIIKQNIGIPGLTIDSFEADYLDLLEVIGKDYGEIILTRLALHEEELITAMFPPLADTIKNDLTDLYISQSEFANKDFETKVTCLTSSFSLTLINCDIYDLEIDLNPLVGTAVHNKFKPVLMKLLIGLFNDADARVERGNTPFYRHFIKTADGRILEAARGYIGEDWYLLTLIK